MRRVASARMQQNVSVSESLQHFIASRSNSVARSSRGAISQNEDEGVTDLAPNTANLSKVNNRQQETSGDAREESRTSTSMERAAKYLRRDTSSRQHDSIEAQAPTRHNFNQNSVD